MRTPRKGEYTRFESDAYYHLIISGGFMPQPFQTDSIVQFYFISPFSPVWGKGGFLGSHHYFVTILRTISFVKD